MQGHYFGKKKFKKIYQKLEKISPTNLKIVLDDYFYGVCQKYYQRQLYIWYYLKYRYNIKKQNFPIVFT